MEAIMSEETAMAETSNLDFEISADSFDTWDDADSFADDALEGNGNEESNTDSVEAAPELAEAPKAAPEVSIPESEANSIEDLLDDNQVQDQSVEEEGDASASEPTQDAEEVAGEPEPEIIYEEVKINGELQKFDRNEVLAKGKEMLAGEIAFDKKFSELDRERKTYQAEVDEVNNYVNTFGAKMREGDGLGAMEYLATFSGMAPHDFKQQLIKSILPEIERYQDMDPRDIDLEYKQQEAEYYKKQNESVLIQQQEREANTALQIAENTVREAHNFEEADWLDASSHVKAHMPDGLTYSPELVRDFMINERAENVMNSVDASLVENVTLYETMQSIIKNNPDFTEEDLRDILTKSNEVHVEEPAKEEVKQKLANKLTSTPQGTKQTKKDPIQPIMVDGEEITDWDDIL